MKPVVHALWAFVVNWFRSRLSLQLETGALRHQLAVYQSPIRRPRIRPTDRILWSWLSRHWSAWRAAPDLRAAHYRNRLAAQAVSRSLVKTESAKQTRPTLRATRSDRLDPQDLIGQCLLGLTAHRRRVEKARHRSRQMHGGEVSGSPPQTALPHLEGVLEESRQRAHGRTYDQALDASISRRRPGRADR
jgi:hypothetical protein